MRDGLKKRIYNKNGNKMETIQKNYILQNSYAESIGMNYCAAGGNCEIGSLENLEVRNYRAQFRQPIRGTRKQLQCNGNSSNLCYTFQEIYKDTYTKNVAGLCSANEFGTLPNTRTYTTDTSKSSSGITARASRPLIRSGMQPNIAGQQNSGRFNSANNPNRYSYSYRELLNNRRKATYMKKLPVVESDNADKQTYGYGGKSCRQSYGQSSEACNNETIFNPSNDKFKTQGAVSSSSRIDRLKLDVIRGSSKCSSGKTGPLNARSNCNGRYFAGRQRFLGYKSIYNNDHVEVNNPQVNARARARGSYTVNKNKISQTQKISSDNVCCA